eukprot:Hpha_TRINITY_DN24340_c0_g1::TRINITY_DN24340_c0_g1_i1::g.147965::m.147965
MTGCIPTVSLRAPLYGYGPSRRYPLVLQTRVTTPQAPCPPHPPDQISPKRIRAGGAQVVCDRPVRGRTAEFRFLHLSFPIVSLVPPRGEGPGAAGPDHILSILLRSQSTRKR